MVELERIFEIDARDQLLRMIQDIVSMMRPQKVEIPSDRLLHVPFLYEFTWYGELVARGDLIAEGDLTVV